LQVAIAATAWGTWSLFFRPAHVDPMWTSPLVLAVITVVCAPLLLRRRARGPEGGGPRRIEEWGWILVLGVVDSGNALCFFAAMNVTTIAIAVLSHYLAPLLVALFAPAALGTRRDRRAMPLAGVALVGLALVLEPWKLRDGAAGRPVLGAILGAASAVCYAANVIVTKKMGTRFTSEEQLVWHSVVSALLLFAVAIIMRAPTPDAHGIGLVALAGVVVGATAGLLFLYGLRRIPAEHAGMLCFLEPLTAVVVAWIAWSERPGPIAMVGGVLVVASGAMTLTATRSEAGGPA
jgi:drug/metabolite transporter (DMT)-like permease